MIKVAEFEETNGAEKHRGMYCFLPEFSWNKQGLGKEISFDLPSKWL